MTLTNGYYWIRNTRIDAPHEEVAQFLDGEWWLIDRHCQYSPKELTDMGWEVLARVPPPPEHPE